MRHWIEMNNHRSQTDDGLYNTWITYECETAEVRKRLLVEGLATRDSNSLTTKGIRSADPAEVAKTKRLEDCYGYITRVWGMRDGKLTEV